MKMLNQIFLPLIRFHKCICGYFNLSFIAFLSELEADILSICLLVKVPSISLTLPLLTFLVTLLTVIYKYLRDFIVHRKRTRLPCSSY